LAVGHDKFQYQRHGEVDALLQHPPEWDISCYGERRENEDGLQAHFFNGEVAQVGAAFALEWYIELFGLPAVVPVH